MKSCLVLVLMVLFSELSPAGIITGGGGGLIDSQSSSPNDVSRVMQEWGGSIIQAWLNRLEMEYELQDANSQLQSPFYKIFSDKAAFYEKIKKTGVEIRYNEPCFDAEHKAFDGSVFARHANAVCVSAFSAAPKVTIYSVESQILALLMHEFSHLAGCDEAEAVAIQLRAIDDFSRVRFDNLETQRNALRIGLGYTVNNIKSDLEAILNPSDTVTTSELRSAAKAAILGLSSIVSQDGKFAFLGGHSLYDSEQVKAQLLVAIISSCVFDETLNESAKSKCKVDLESLFQNKNEISVKDVLTVWISDSPCRQIPDFCYSAAEFQTFIVKPKNPSDLKLILNNISRSLKEMRDQVSDLGQRRNNLISDYASEGK